MPIPVTSLDDRTFDDLVAEARLRLQNHLPELAQVAEGDPLHALIDVFAWMTESVIYRANLIPERQRQAFLNLLQLPMHPAQPARGLVCIDAKPQGGQLPPLVPDESELHGGETTFTTRGELQPLPLGLKILVKEPVDPAAAGLTADELKVLYAQAPRVAPFQPRSFVAGRDAISAKQALGGRLYLLIYLPEQEQVADADALRQALTDKILNIGIAPLRDVPGDVAKALPARQLRWELIWQQRTGTHNERPVFATRFLPLDVVDDSSRGARRSGVVRLRMPRSEAVLNSDYDPDPDRAGLHESPPEPPADVDPRQVLFWLSLSAPEEADLDLGYLGINAVEVLGQGVVRNEVLGTGNGRPGQTLALAHANVDAASLQLEVSEREVYVPWRQVSHFAASGPDDPVYRLDAATGTVSFGDGLRGMRPAANSRIRAAFYRHGGGTRGNLGPGAIKQLAGGRSELTVRQEWPTQGGLDAETVPEAEQRIPQYLSHRNRAVTRDDLVQLAMDNPLTPLGRAEVVRGLYPGNTRDTVRTDVPGVVSLFVMPPGEPAMSAAPRPTVGLLRDVYRYLDERKLLGTELYVLSPEFVPVALSVSISVLDPQTVTETQQAVSRALLRYLWALAPGGPTQTGWPLGRAVDPKELIACAARVPGVLAVEGLRLFSRHAGEWSESLDSRQTAAEIALDPYQLPEVMQIRVERNEAAPQPPEITQPGQDEGEGGTAVAVPVIPDVC